jgi:corrinoid protein of di/trimethylamine methyltransferase
MLLALRGEMPDVIPFAPRLDLWFSANRAAGTLPPKYRDFTHPFQVARTEGWALHQINPAYQEARKPEDNLHWALGILTYKETAFGYRFTGDVEIGVQREGDRTRVAYRTPRGTVQTTVLYTEAMRRGGVSAFSIEEYAIKSPADYGPVGYIFEHLELYPDWQDFISLQEEVGEDGVAFTMAGRAASPMHHIQKYLIDATDFFFHYRDFEREIRRLAESIGPFFDRIIEIVGESPAEAVYWGANFDDMITFPTYFERDILPWIRKAADALGSKDIVVSCHCDGENRGLMDLIRESGMHVAESVCPYPMTKVRIGEYYARWCDKLTVFGGIPSSILLEESTSELDFISYVDDLFKAVAPGRRIIFGIADSTPPGAVFSRLVQLGERIAEEGLLPIRAGGFRPVPLPQEKKENRASAAAFQVPEEFVRVQQDVTAGDHIRIVKHIADLLETGADADDILNQAMLPSMEAIGERFKAGEVFIPEVLLSARAMNEATRMLEPHLSKGKRQVKGKILIGTVFGDLHDIGKNIVIIMLRGMGFEVEDAGINVPVKDFVNHVEDFRPDIVGLSALLTTTMPQMKKVIEALRENGLRERVKVIVGGAPVNAKFAKDIGADGYAADAGEAANLAKRLMSGSNPKHETRKEESNG